MTVTLPRKRFPALTLMNVLLFVLPMKMRM